MKFFRICFVIGAVAGFLAIAAGITGCATTSVSGGTPDRSSGRTYESGQAIGVHPDGGFSTCDRMLEQGEGEELTREVQTAVRECYQRQLRVHQAGMRQQSLDHREVVDMRRQAERERDSAVRRGRSIADTTIRIVERIDRLSR